jgi:hypothetical protein
MDRTSEHWAKKKANTDLLTLLLGPAMRTCHA